MTTAIVAAQRGLDVLLVEKTASFGGTTALSGGAAWIPLNHLMETAGEADTREEAQEYLRNVLGTHYQSEKIKAFLDAAPEMLRYMEDHTEVAFTRMLLPDYHATLGGARRGRSLIARDYDGSRLGKYLADLKRPLDELVIFGSMQVGGADVHPLRKALRDGKSFRHAARLFANFVMQSIRYGRGTRLVGGNALAGRLLRSALDAGVTLWPQSPAVDLIKTGDRVTGVLVDHQGVKTQINVRRGVVLASGGFGANAEWRPDYIPLTETHISMQPVGNVGDGIAMGTAAGGHVPQDNASNAIFCPISQVRLNDGAIKRFPHIGIDRYMPGSIAIGPDGKRFVNEGGTYVAFVRAMQERRFTKAYLIGDRPFLRRYGMGLVRPFPYPVKPWLENGYLVEAKTVAELADRIGVDPHQLEETVARFNAGARDGADPDFARGADPLSRFRGDQDHKPNPSLGIIGKAPFYAIGIVPGDLSTVTGLDTDAHARVLDRNGDPIPGLHAVGTDMNSISRGLYPGGGFSIGPALTFGYLIGKQLAEASNEISSMSFTSPPVAVGEKIEGQHGTFQG